MPKKHELVLAGSVETELTLEIKRAVWVWAWNKKKARVIVPEWGSWDHFYKVDIAFVDPGTRVRPPQIHYVEVKISKSDLKKDIYRPDPQWEELYGAWKASALSAQREMQIRYGAAPRLFRSIPSWDFPIEQQRELRYRDHRWGQFVCYMREVEDRWWRPEINPDPFVVAALNDPRIGLLEKDDHKNAPVFKEKAQKVGKFYRPSFLSNCHYLWIAAPAELVPEIPKDLGVLEYADGEMRVARSPKKNSDFPTDEEKAAKKLCLFYEEAARGMSQRLAQVGGAEVYLGRIEWKGEEDER